MDDRTGHFVTGNDTQELLKQLGGRVQNAAERLKAKDGVFFVGDTVTVRGSLFRVAEIHTDRLVLLLLPPVK